MPKAKKNGAGTRVNKSAWIRAQPATMSAKDVVAKAKGEGIKLSISQVYTARSAAKKLGNGGSSAAPASKRTARTGTTDDELTFRRLVLAIGLDRAEAYMTSLRRSVGL